MTTHALNTSNPVTAPGTGLTVLRYADLIVMVLALPVVLALSLPLLGYGVASVVWVLQRVVQHYANAKAEASDDPRTSVGVLAGSMLGRGWLTAASILAVGLIGTRPDGLTAGVLVISLFTIYFAAQMVVRPFDEAARKPLPPKENI